jgi:hypothetical protein
MVAPAHVITIGLDSDLNKAIRAWFHEFNFLPPIPLSSAKVDTVMLHDASFAGLLGLMAASPHKNFILIIHGHEDGSGPWLKLAPEQAHPHTTHFDLQRLMDLDNSGPELSRADQATMGVSRHQAHHVIELMHKVREKGIDCVEFRSCNLGRNALSLDRFRRFFGARVAGAPNIHTLFGLVPAITGSHFLQTHRLHHPGHNWETYNFPKALKEPDLVCCFQLNSLNKPEAGGHVIADSAATLDAWIKKYLVRTGGHSTGHMAMHALWVADVKVPPKHPHEKARFVPAAIDLEPEDLNDPLGGWGGPPVRRLIPPLSQNYAKHIIYAR